MADYQQGWIKINYSFDVYHEVGNSIGPGPNYQPAQYMANKKNNGTNENSYDEVGDYSYVWDNRPYILSYYQIGVNGYTRIENGREYYEFNSYDLAMLKHTITDLVVDPAFTPTLLDNDNTITVTLTNNWVGRTAGEAQSVYVWTHPKVE